MAGRGPAAKSERRRANTPERGDWKATDEIGWRHGEIPAPPEGSSPETVETWNTWFQAWYAAHWEPEDVPALRTGARLYEQVLRGEFTRATELRLWQDTWGVSPKGQQDRRWEKPKAEKVKASGQVIEAGNRWGDLKVADGA